MFLHILDCQIYFKINKDLTNHYTLKKKYPNTLIYAYALFQYYKVSCNMRYNIEKNQWLLTSQALDVHAKDQVLPL